MAINLKKGGRIDLKKNEASMTKVYLGLAWSPIKKGGLFGMFQTSEDVDLDASCVAILSNGTQVPVFYANLQAFGGAIRHSGDNRTGEGTGDDETIAIDLEALPSDVVELIITISSFRGQTFKSIQDAHCHIRDEKYSMLAEFTMAGGEGKTGIVVGRMTKAEGVWSFEAIGEYRDGRTFAELLR